MSTKPAGTVAVDLDLTTVTIRAAGLLDAENISGLLAVASRAQRTLPDFMVRLDLEHLRAACPDALHRLHQSTAVTAAVKDRALTVPAPALRPRLAA
ncbi:hypothetical protein ACTWLI_11835 [Arthrobacter sp. Hor0625]|uniref:hypothetical protein n=1 Tax=Arthrobacter sp. Hor0625 TaxID=3457358 RepID=UPI00403E7936